MGKISGKFMIGMLIFVLLIANVSALGITPARTTIDFSAGMKKSVSFSVINSEHRDMNLVVYAQGELNQSILFKENSFSMGSGEETKQLSYDIVLPQTLSPGAHVAEIVVLQLPSKSGVSDAFVGAALAVVTQLYVYVPYPGKYAQAEMNIVNAEQGKEATFVIPVISLGNLDLASVRANIDIYNKLNEKVGSFNTADISIKSGEKTDIVAKWKADVPVGNYRAVATVIYDGETLTLERPFTIGSAVLDLQQVDVKGFTLGEIAKFEMLIENKWSEPIKGAYSLTQVHDSEGKVMAEFKSATYDIEPLNKALMVSYWDTAGVRVGTYDTSVYLRYSDKSIQKDLKLKVAENEITAIGLGYVISQKTTSSGKDNTLVILLVAVIGVLVLINVVWFMVLRKYLAKRSDK